jgi:DNA repair ATPase RecN
MSRTAIMSSSNKTITMPLSEYENMVSNAKMKDSIISERTILEVSKFTEAKGLETITYVSVDKDKLFSELQTRVKQLESREETYGKQINDWNEYYRKTQAKIDELGRHKRMSESRDDEFRKLVGAYDEVKRELDEYKTNRVSGVRRFFRRFWRK